MTEFLRQIAMYYVSLSIFMISMALLLWAITNAAINLTRMIQLQIATNVTISRELAAVQNAIAASGQFVPPPAAPQMPSSAPMFAQPIPKSETRIKPPDSMEGEILFQSDSELADEEAIRLLRANRKSDGGMTDEDWQRQIEQVQALGFKEPE